MDDVLDHEVSNYPTILGERLGSPGMIRIFPILNEELVGTPESSKSQGSKSEKDMFSICCYEFLV